MRTICVFLVLAALAAVVSCNLSGVNGLQQRHSKAARAVRGFKNMALSTARGFGKRSDWRIPQDQTDSSPQTLEQGLPIAWLADQMQNSPGLARLILRRFVDQDKDDHLSPEELLKYE